MQHLELQLQPLYYDARVAMASKQSNVDFVLEQMAGAGDVSARKMFGEFGIYCQGKIVALFCDDQLFVKPTDAGRAFIEQVTEAPPYPGAKPWFFIAGDRCEDGDWLSELIRITARGLPPPQPKTAKGKGKPRPKAKAKPRAQAKAKPRAQAKAKPRAQAKAKPRAQAKAKPRAQAKAKPRAQAKAKPRAQAKAKPRAQAKAKPRAQAKAKPRA